jgi:hypothetical protein
VRIRSRKPWVFARRRLLGWKVRLLTRGLLGVPVWCCVDPSGQRHVDESTETTRRHCWSARHAEQPPSDTRTTAALVGRRCGHATTAVGLTA